MLWQYDEQSGVITARPDGKRLRRRGPPPCWYPDGCEKGTIDKPKTLWRMNENALRHWYECTATGLWPNDPLVRYHAGILYRLREMIHRQHDIALHEFIRHHA